MNFRRAVQSLENTISATIFGVQTPQWVCKDHLGIECLKPGDLVNIAQKEDVIIRHVDFSPLYKSTVGFDRLFNLLDTMGQPEKSAPAYPPYNIERTGENAYRISMAVAGFSENDLEIESKENTLLVKGEQPPEDKNAGEILFRGIAARNFERRFQLADHVEVRDAQLENGLLHIDLVREIPDAMKPRKIKIGQSGAKQIESKKASK